MTPELAYFLKINVAIALFYAFYRLFFHKDTFFHWRRMALLCFFAISMLYPLLNIQGWIKAHEPMVAMADLYATILLPEQVVTPTQETVINWQEVIMQFAKIIYWSGMLLLTHVSSYNWVASSDCISNAQKAIYKEYAYIY